MRRTWFALGAALVFAAGCGVPQDDGVVMGCFGLINENFPPSDVFSNQVVTNMFFGGCSPDDVGMQVMERATQAASQDQNALALKCNDDCNLRLAAYKNAHNEVDLPLTCQTLFASQCDALGSDAPTSGTGLAYQAGGPADTRFTMTGTVTVIANGIPADPIPARGIIDVTMAPCAAGATCPFTVSRFDFVSTNPSDMSFDVGGMTFSIAQVQNQGLIVGSRGPSSTTIGSNAIEAEVTGTLVNGGMNSFHVRNSPVGTNSNAITKSGTNLTLEQFFSSLNVTLVGPAGSNSSVQISATGTVSGHRPVSDITSLQTTYECQCKECTTAEFAANATDQDNDLQSLAWKLNGVPQIGDGTSAPQTLDLQLGLGKYTVSLVATDTRGAAAASSQQFTVVDTTPPVVTAPPNVTLRSCDFPDLGGTATATDICSDKVVISNNASGHFNVGTNTITWSGEDASGNVGTATQTVTVTSTADVNCCPQGYNRIVITAQTPQPVTGTSGNDCIIGTSNNDTINGLAGNDIIIAGGGQDTISGGDGDDIILGGDGNDVINGGNGNDKLAGGTAQDTINGNAGNDTIWGGDGDDIIDGGDGADVIYGNQGQDRIIGGLANDTIDGGFGVDQINGGTTPSTGNAGDDTINGSFDNDVISDTVGNNKLYGFQGDDQLTGGPGSDTIWGGGGHNTCNGGGGADAITCSQQYP